MYSGKTYTAEQYFKSINKFIDCIGSNTKNISFDELYRSNYNATIQKNYDIINLAFETARNEISRLDYSKQVVYLNMLNNIFMYPIRMNVIDKYVCLLCDKHINYDNLYCNEHIAYKKHLDSIVKFKSFNNEGLVGGNIYEDLLAN